jgi:hypothetical protein
MKQASVSCAPSSQYLSSGRLCTCRSTSHLSPFHLHKHPQPHLIRSFTPYNPTARLSVHARLQLPSARETRASADTRRRIPLAFSLSQPSSCSQCQCRPASLTHSLSSHSTPSPSTNAQRSTDHAQSPPLCLHSAHRTPHSSASSFPPPNEERRSRSSTASDSESLLLSR